MKTLVSMLALAAGLSACANQGRMGAPLRSSLAPANEVSVASLDPLDAPPPPMAASAPALAAPSDSPLLVPPSGEGSQRVPLGTLGTSGDPKPAPAPPTRLAAGSTVAKPQSPAVSPSPQAREFTPAPLPTVPAEEPDPIIVATPPQPVSATPTAAFTATPQTPRAITLNVQPGAGSHRTPRGVPAAGSETRPAPTIEVTPTVTAPPLAAKPSPFEEETTIISSTTAAPAAQGREFVPASVVAVAKPSAPPALGEMPFSQAEKNIARRFETLARLRDEALITQDEFNRRRSANLGAILPYSQNPPGVGLDRAVPSGDAIVARLGALRRSFEMRAITAQQHALERTMILNALLPENPEQRTARKPPPEDVIQGAAMVGHLEALREEGVITQAELDAERKMIDAVLRTGLFPPKGADAEAPKQAQAKSAAKPTTPAASGASASENPMETQITGPVLHLASFRSETSARQAWQQVLEGNKATLANLKPIIRRVDLGEGRGIFYRLMTGSFTSMADAEATCVKLKQNNQFCRASADGA